MKTSAALLLLAVLCVPALQAQELAPVRVTIKKLDGGLRSMTKTDPEKHISEETITDAGNKVLKKTTYILGPDNLATEAIFTDGKGTILYKAVYQRDSVGHVIEVDFSTADDVPIGKRIYNYGPAGPAPIQVTDYDANGQLVVTSVPATSTAKRH